jgi:hypothetical protein
MNTAYSYCILRYRHDVVNEEFVNFGVVVWSGEKQFLDSLLSPSPARAAQMFPSMDKRYYRNTIGSIKRALSKLAEKYRETPLSIDFPTPLGEDLPLILRSVIAEDDSAWSWSDIKHGVTRDMRAVGQALYDRYVMRYSQAGGMKSRSDEDIWRCFNSAFEAANVQKIFSAHTVIADRHVYEFERAWKNGVWNLFTPISFDLRDAGTFKSKAERFLGQGMMLTRSTEALKVYFLIGEPSQPDMRVQFDQALDILDQTPVDHEMYFEDQAENLAIQLKSLLDAHERAPKTTPPF